MGTFAAFVTFCAFFRPAAAANRPASILGPKKLGEKMPKIGILPLTLTLATIDSQKVTKDTKTNSEGAPLQSSRPSVCFFRVAVAG
jgi:hypothetical protein